MGFIVAGLVFVVITYYLYGHIIAYLDKSKDWHSPRKQMSPKIILDSVITKDIEHYAATMQSLHYLISTI